MKPKTELFQCKNTTFLLSKLSSRMQLIFFLIFCGLVFITQKCLFFFLSVDKWCLTMCPFSAGADVSRNVFFSVNFFEKTSFFWKENPFLVNCEPVVTFLANVHKKYFGEPYKAPFKSLIWSLSIDRKKQSSIGTLDLIRHLKQLCNSMMRRSRSSSNYNNLGITYFITERPITISEDYIFHYRAANYNNRGTTYFITERPKTISEPLYISLQSAQLQYQRDYIFHYTATSYNIRGTTYFITERPITISEPIRFSLRSGQWQYRRNYIFHYRAANYNIRGTTYYITEWPDTISEAPYIFDYRAAKNLSWE